MATDNSSSSSVTAAELAEVEALPAASVSRATPLSRRDVALLANPKHHEALRKHTASFADQNLDIEKAIALATETARGFDVAERLQALADKAWQRIDPGHKEAERQVSLIARTAQKAPEGSPIRTNLGAFVTKHAEDLGLPQRNETRNRNAKAKKAEAKPK